MAVGVGLYIRNDLNYCVENHLSLDQPDCESLFIKIKNNSLRSKVEKDFLVGMVYKHPHTVIMSNYLVSNFQKL